jgi:putative endonuclease
MADKDKLGQKGEDIAMEYLQNKGYKILDTNWKFGKLEIDIIARDMDFLVIVEVKTRSDDEFAEPLEAVTKAKQKKLIRAANEYVYKRNIKTEVRFDIISILLSNDTPEIEHIEDAFYPLL